MATHARVSSVPPGRQVPVRSPCPPAPAATSEVRTMVAKRIAVEVAEPVGDATLAWLDEQLAQELDVDAGPPSRRDDQDEDERPTIPWARPTLPSLQDADQPKPRRRG